MKVSDYIVDYFIQKGICDVFGYPGGMITHLMDSLSKRLEEIQSHVAYHEQGAAFAACGYAQASGKTGVAYATSGPGATNLITGICNAYFDSIPVVFITGQVNTFESKGNLDVRQRGFQETDIVSMVKGVTKYSAYVDMPERIKYYLDKAFYEAESGRKGPVLLDIPMDIFRADVEIEKLDGYIKERNKQHLSSNVENIIEEALQTVKRPVLLIGNGVKIAGETRHMRDIVNKLKIPTVSTMLGIDIIDNKELNYGFIGAYGSRAANFIVAKSDLIISFGARLDVRQTGAMRENFAPHAKLIRIDIDSKELEYRVKENEIGIYTDITEILPVFDSILLRNSIKFDEWIDVCKEIRDITAGLDYGKPNTYLKRMSDYLSDDAFIITDVGQNQVWVAQSLELKEKQKVFFSGGHGAMGYSLPAAIGCSIATKKKVYSFNGDGGIQMNIQEMQLIARENLPVKIILFNNYSLGMIRHFQEIYFSDNYTQTTESGGYSVPNFKLLADAYGIQYYRIDDLNDMCAEMFKGDNPAFIEIRIPEKTYVYPKLEFGKPNQDQEPLMERDKYNYLMKL